MKTEPDLVLAGYATGISAAYRGAGVRVQLDGDRLTVAFKRLEQSGYRSDYGARLTMHGRRADGIRPHGVGYCYCYSVECEVSSRIIDIADSESWEQLFKILDAMLAISNPTKVRNRDIPQ
jgi:hypothetical protein